jgi:uncharacterized membrane protein YbhN (UPF0104 family)
MVFCSGVSVVIWFRIIRSVLRKCGLLLKRYMLRIIDCNSFNFMLPFMFSGLFP